MCSTLNDQFNHILKISSASPWLAYYSKKIEQKFERELRPFQCEDETRVKIMLYQMCALWFATNFDAKVGRGSYTERMVKYKAHEEVQLLEEQTLIIPQEVSDYSITTCKEFCYKVYPIWSVGIKIQEQGLQDAFQPVNLSWFCHKVQKQKQSIKLRSLNFLTDLEVSELAQHNWLKITLQKCANILKF